MKKTPAPAIYQTTPNWKDWTRSTMRLLDSALRVRDEANASHYLRQAHIDLIVAMRLLGNRRAQ